MSDHRRATIEEAQERLAARLMPFEGVEAVGIGRHDGSPCLKVFLSVPQSDIGARIPRRFAGHRVVVTGGGPFRPLSEDT